MMILNQHRPILLPGLFPAYAAFTAVLNAHCCLALAVGICTRIERVSQHAQQAVVARLLPDYRRGISGAANDRHFYLLMAEPEIQLPHTSQFGKLTKQEVYRGTDALI